MVGWPPRDTAKDPFVGFSGIIPLFQVSDGEASTSEHKIRLFNPLSFPVQKAKGTFRIFCHGGSTTYGSPYDGRAAFGRWLEDLLEASQPGTDFEVINAGGLSYASYRIVHLVRETLQYDPDLMVIYTGHNEFLERRTYSNLLAQNPALIAVRTAVERLSLYRALEELLSPILDAVRAPTTRDGHHEGNPDATHWKRGSEKSSYNSNHEPLADEAGTILEEGVVGPEAYHRDDLFAANVVRHFAYNLRKTISLCKKAGVPIIVVEPASKLNDCPPFKAQHRPGLSRPQLEQLGKQFDTAENLLSENRFSEALTVLKDCIATDSLYADYFYLKGKALLRLGRNSEALAWFIKARDLDVCPLRCVSALEIQLRDVCLNEGVPLVPFRETVLRNARETGERTGVPGNESFLDHVHPTLELHQALAELLLEKMVTLGMIHPVQRLTLAQRNAIYQKGVNSFDKTYLAMKDLRLGRLLLWAGLTDQARGPLENAAGILENPRTVDLLARLLMISGSQDRAVQEFARALALSGGNPYLHLNLANAYLETGSRNQAILACRKILAGNNPIPEAGAFLAMIHIEDGLARDALELVDEGLKKHPGHPSLTAARSLALGTLGRTSEAIPLMVSAVERDPHNVVNMVQLARICSRQGKADQALRCLEIAVKTGDYSADDFENDADFDLVRYMPQFGKIAGGGAGRRE